MKVFSYFAMTISLITAGVMISTPQELLAQKEKKDKKDKKKKKKGKEEQDAVPELAPTVFFTRNYKNAEGLLNIGVPEGAKFNLENLGNSVGNESDLFYLGDMTRKIGVALKDKELEVKGIDIMLASPFMPAANKPIFFYIKGKYDNSLKNYESAISNFRQSYDLGFRAGSIETFLGILYNKNNQHEEAIAWYERAAVSLAEKGPNPDIDKLYGNMAIAAIESKNGPLIDSTFRKVLSRTMDKNLWHDGLAQLVSISNFNNQEVLDVLRLMRETDTLLFKNEYSEYVEAADARRLPNEVVTIINLGIEKGHIPQNDTIFKQYADIANARLSGDRADLPNAEKDARTSTTGRSAIATADAYFSYGEYQTAVDLYKLAIDKGGIDADRALNRIGIAQLKLGDLESAKSSFAALTSPNRKNIGDYWTIYINNLQNEQ